MDSFNRTLSVFADGEPVTSSARTKLLGHEGLGLYPCLFMLNLLNLAEEDYLLLSRAREVEVKHGEVVLVSGLVSDVFRNTKKNGTETHVAIAPGLALWEAVVSVDVEAGASVSETVRRLLEASGTGVQLLSFPGEDPVFSRGQAFCGRAAECIAEALSAAGARGLLVPSGLCIVPADPLPATLHLTEKDLKDRPAFADGGRKMILSTTVTGFRPGEEMTLETDGKVYTGLILERMVDADNTQGPWNTQLLLELR